MSDPAREPIRSTARISGARPSRASRAARLLAELAGFAALLFLARFVARAHLVPFMDQECHIGGIAADVLAHGVRFPLLVYAPNEYDNGSFFSGLLAAVSFTLLGRSLLALKLVTHLISAAGAVAGLSLLRGCLNELGVTSRPPRAAAIAAFIIAIALAPRIVTLCSMYAVGNHAEGAAIAAILLAVFTATLDRRTALGTGAFWALAGFALYVNKAAMLAVPVLAVAEAWHARRTPRRLVAACGGFAAGVLPELLVVAQRHAMGWTALGSKVQRHAVAFPRSFVESIVNLADHRAELLALWALALAAAVAAIVRAGTRRGTGTSTRRSAFPAATMPVTLAIVLAFTLVHLGALTVMAQGGADSYAIYAYPGLTVLVAALVGSVCARMTHRSGNVAAWTAAAAVVLITIVHRPDAVTAGPPTVSDLWQDRAGAACWWRFAEGFEREHEHGLAPPGRTFEQHAIERCRSFSDRDQVLDCIGGIARELHWRRDGIVAGQPPKELTPDEAGAYAYYYGTHRSGDVAPCGDLANPDLAGACAAAVKLECLVLADVTTRFLTGRGIDRPRCDIPQPPMSGYWRAMRSHLLARSGGTAPDLTPISRDTDLAGCRTVFEDCF